MKKIISSIVLLTLYLQGFAQQGVTSGGNTLQFNEINVMYAIGQSSIQSLDGINSYLTQGIIQPATSNVVLSIEHSEVTSKIKIFPNPTSKIVKIESEEKIKKVELLDYMGRVLKQYSSDFKYIDLENFEGSYFILNFYTNQGKIKAFKIIKK